MGLRLEGGGREGSKCAPFSPPERPPRAPLVSPLGTPVVVGFDWV
jgi:hypothetical protein